MSKQAQRNYYVYSSINGTLSKACLLFFFFFSVRHLLHKHTHLMPRRLAPWCTYPKRIHISGEAELLAEKSLHRTAYRNKALG